MGSISLYGGRITLTTSQVIFTPIFLAPVKRIPLAQIKAAVEVWLKNVL